MVELIFNWKILILIGIILFGAVFIYVLALPPIYAGWCAGWEDCIQKLYEQNERVEKKLDWNNCIAKHKEARDYQPPNDDSGFFETQTYQDLVKHCGEMP